MDGWSWPDAPSDDDSTLFGSAATPFGFGRMSEDDDALPQVPSDVLLRDAVLGDALTPKRPRAFFQDLDEDESAFSARRKVARTAGVVPVLHGSLVEEAVPPPLVAAAVPVRALSAVPARAVLPAAVPGESDEDENEDENEEEEDEDEDGAAAKEAAADPRMGGPPEPMRFGFPRPKNALLHGRYVVNLRFTIGSAALGATAQYELAGGLILVSHSGYKKRTFKTRLEHLGFVRPGHGLPRRCEAASVHAVRTAGDARLPDKLVLDIRCLGKYGALMVSSCGTRLMLQRNQETRTEVTVRRAGHGRQTVATLRDHHFTAAAGPLHVLDGRTVCTTDNKPSYLVVSP